MGDGGQGRNSRIRSEFKSNSAPPLPSYTPLTPPTQGRNINATDRIIFSQRKRITNVSKLENSCTTRHYEMKSANTTLEL